jgi:Flp pilus assembly protein TadB
MRACPSCSKEISEFAVVCPFCGWNKREEERIQEEKWKARRLEREREERRLETARLAEENRKNAEIRRAEEEQKEKIRKHRERLDNAYLGVFWGAVISSAILLYQGFSLDATVALAIVIGLVIAVLVYRI